jgi:plasmid stability protein
VPVTLTIKQVPERIAKKLRTRAAASHRSLQGELMSILHEVLDEPQSVSEPEAPAYRIKGRPRAAPVHGRRLTLSELWERAQQLGGESPSESVGIVRRLRDERHNR